jgi:hypothetical protein
MDPSQKSELIEFCNSHHIPQMCREIKEYPLTYISRTNCSTGIHPLIQYAPTRAKQLEEGSLTLPRGCSFGEYRQDGQKYRAINDYKEGENGVMRLYDNGSRFTIFTDNTGKIWIIFA